MGNSNNKNLNNFIHSREQWMLNYGSSERKVLKVRSEKIGKEGVGHDGIPWGHQAK